jgi:hypothetical protein
MLFLDIVKLKKNMFSEKGYAFIIIVMITIGLISGVILMSNNITQQEDKTKELLRNYEIEFSKISTQDINEETISNFAESFVDFINAQSYDVEFCSIFADDEYYYVSNYLGKSCIFYVNDVNKAEINNNNTEKIDIFINDTNIYLCNCEYNNYNSYYIKIYDSKNQIIKKNMR